MSAMEQRLIGIEEKLAFVEKLTGDLNGAVLELSRQLETARREIKRLESKIEAFEARPDDSTDPLDERPPHY